MVLIGNYIMELVAVVAEEFVINMVSQAEVVVLVECSVVEAEVVEHMLQTGISVVLEGKELFELFTTLLLKLNL